MWAGTHIMWPAVTIVIGAAWALALCWYDMKYQRLPDNLTMPVLCCLIIIAARMNYVALFGGLVWFFLYFMIALLVGGIGGGDIKLAPSLGIIIGADGIWPVFTAIFLAQMLTLVGAMVFKRTKIPHGPAMILGCIIVLACHPASSTFIHFDRG